MNVEKSGPPGDLPSAFFLPIPKVYSFFYPLIYPPWNEHSAWKMESQKEMNHLPTVKGASFRAQGIMFSFFWLAFFRLFVGANASLVDLQQTWVALLCPSYFGSFDWWLIPCQCLDRKKKSTRLEPPTIGGLYHLVFPCVFFPWQKLRCAQWHWWDQWMPSSWVTRRRLSYFSRLEAIKKRSPFGCISPPMSQPSSVGLIWSWAILYPVSPAHPSKDLPMYGWFLFWMPSKQVTL